MSVSVIFWVLAKHRKPTLAKQDDHNAPLPYLHHFEVRLRRATLGTDPLIRNVLPPCPRRNVVIWPAFGLVINEPTGHALPLTHIMPLVTKGARHHDLAWGLSGVEPNRRE